MKTIDVLEVLRSLAPENTALDGDPVGLLIGDELNGVVNKLGVCLDATPTVARRAAVEGIQMLVAHHPLIYHALRRIQPQSDPIAETVATLIKGDVALYAMHTNWDRASRGINDNLANLLRLQDIRPLGADGIAALPRVGRLAAPMALGEFKRAVCESLDCTGPNALRVNSFPEDRIVSKVAVCGGAGAGLAADVLAAGADTYVTSDVRHHEFVEATARGLALIDAGHGATESPGMKSLAEMLVTLLPEVEVIWLADS